MGIHGALTHCNIFVGGLDLTGDANMVKIEASKEVRDRTVFGNVARIRTMGGLAEINFAAAGFHNDDAAGQDVNFRANWATDSICTTVMIPAASGTPVAVGDRAWFFKGVQPQYVTGEAQGNDLLWNLSMQGGSTGYPLCFGYVLNAGTTAIIDDGNGTGYQIGTIAANQKGYALMHVVSVSSGDSIDVIIQSDDNAGFTSAITRFTFSNFNAVGAQFLTPLPGPIDDDYWRAVYNVSGEAVSIKAAISLAIQ